MTQERQDDQTGTEPEEAVGYPFSSDEPDTDGHGYRTPFASDQPDTEVDATSDRATGTEPDEGVRYPLSGDDQDTEGHGLARRPYDAAPPVAEE